MKQRSSEWFKARDRMFTASRALTIATNGSGLMTYCKELVEGKKNNFSNEHTKRGIELEPRAIDEYENQNFIKVEEVGFITNKKYQQAGASPDGLIGENGLIEVKCLMDEKYIDCLFKMKIEKAHLYQMQMQMMITDRGWCDYVIYNPNFKQCLLVKRVYHNINIQQEIQLGLTAGRRILKSLINKK